MTRCCSVISKEWTGYLEEILQFEYAKDLNNVFLRMLAPLQVVFNARGTAVFDSFIYNFKVTQITLHHIFFKFNHN